MSSRKHPATPRPKPILTPQEAAFDVIRSSIENTFAVLRVLTNLKESAK